MSLPEQLKRNLRSYERDELRAVIGEGASCVTFQYCFSLLHTFSGETEIVVVRGWWDGFLLGFWHTVGTALLGWWGIHGLYLTPYCLFINLSGGRNVTQEVLATLESDALSVRLLGREFSGFDDRDFEIQSPTSFLSELEEQDRDT